MERLEHYINDGANWQAQAILAIIRGRHYGVTEDFGYNSSLRESRAQIEVGRYENCREQGYVFGLFYDSSLVKYYAVYEHRNSDRLCILTSTNFCINTPGPDVMFGPDRGKYDVDADFSYGSVEKASDWILSDMKQALLNLIQEKAIDIHSQEISH